MKIFLDTNILLRVFLKDVPSQFEQCQNLISAIETGQFQAYTSSIVFLESSYVLKGVYKIPFEEVLKIMDAISDIRNLTIIEKTNTKKALEFYKRYRIKFTDCLIASQLPKDATLISFDEELGKISEVTTKKPQDLLN